MYKKVRKSRKREKEMLKYRMKEKEKIKYEVSGLGTAKVALASRYLTYLLKACCVGTLTNKISTTYYIVE